MSKPRKRTLDTRILTISAHVLIRAFFQDGQSPRQIARRFGIGYRLVEQVLREAK